jgi:hypothetical protein
MVVQVCAVDHRAGCTSLLGTAALSRLQVPPPAATYLLEL